MTFFVCRTARGCPASADQHSDTLSRLDRVLVLPDANDGPTRLAEDPIGIRVPAPVALDLVPPPGGVCLRPGGMQRTTVPETPVDHDGDAGGSEDHVGQTAEGRDRTSMHSVAKAEGVQFLSKEQLGLSVPRALSAHPR